MSPTSIQTVDHRRSARQPHPPSCNANGSVSGTLGRPDGFDLWVFVGTLGAGSSLTWGTDHGDEALYVSKGGIRVDGRVCASRDVVIIESGARAELSAPEDADVIIFGNNTTTATTGGVLGEPFPGGHGLHLIGRDDAPAHRHDHADGTYSETRWYADGVCRTCRIAFSYTESGAPTASPSHAHSEDEIIHVLDGSLQIGRNEVGAGTSVAIPGGMRYSFRTPGPWAFLNYRPRISQYQGNPKDAPYLETWAGFAHQHPAARLIDA